MRRLCGLIAILLVALPLAAQTRRRSTLPVDWTRILLPYVGGTIASSPSGIVADYSIRNDGDRVFSVIMHAELGCPAGICLPPFQYQTPLPPGDTQTTHGQGFVGGEILTVDARSAETIHAAARVHDFYPNVPGPPFEAGTTGPQIPVARQSDFRTSLHLPSLPANVPTLLRVYSLDAAPTVSVKLLRVDEDESGQTEFAAESEIAQLTMQVRPPRYYGPFEVDAGFAERDLSGDLTKLGMAIPGRRLAIQLDSATPIWAMAVQLHPERHLITFTSPWPAEARALAEAEAPTARILVPYLGGPLFDEGALRTEFVVHNTAGHGVAFRFDACGGQVQCPPADLLPSMLPPRLSFIPAQFSPGVVSRGGVFDVAAADENALAFSLRVRAPSAQSTETAHEGPEVPIARERNFRESLHIISAPNHLMASYVDTSLRVYSLDGAPTVKIGIYSVEFGKETLLETLTLDLSPPEKDSPGFAEHDLTSELLALDKQIPQSMIAFRVESPTPVWAMVVQRDPLQHVVAFITQQ